MEEKEAAEVRLHVTSPKDEFEELKQELEKLGVNWGWRKQSWQKLVKN